MSTSEKVGSKQREHYTSMLVVVVGGCVRGKICSRQQAAILADELFDILVELIEFL